MGDDTHKIGFKIGEHPSRIDVYIDRSRINALRFEPVDRTPVPNDEFDLELESAKLEVMGIEDIAFVMNEETFNKFCDLWKEFHNYVSQKGKQNVGKQ